MREMLLLLRRALKTLKRSGRTLCKAATATQLQLNAFKKTYTSPFLVKKEF